MPNPISETIIERSMIFNQQTPYPHNHIESREEDEQQLDLDEVHELEEEHKQNMIRNNTEQIVIDVDVVNLTNHNCSQNRCCCFCDCTLGQDDEEVCIGCSHS